MLTSSFKCFVLRANAKCIFSARNELKFVKFAVAFLAIKYKFYATLIVA